MIPVTVSQGELVNKVSFLRRKRSRVRDQTELAHVGCGLALPVQFKTLRTAGRHDYSARAETPKTAASESWDAEDRTRDCERHQQVEAGFIQVTRQVCLKNEKRASINRRIDDLFQLPIMEEKGSIGREGSWGTNSC